METGKRHKWMHSFHLHTKVNKKFLIFQIDSLPLDILKKALNKGYMPFTKQLIDQEWNLQEMFCGLPSTTPASQVALFYGISLLPGFRFVIKKEGQVFDPNYINTFKLIEDGEPLKEKKGLLREGMGIMCLFSGASTQGISADLLKKNKLILLKFLIFFLNPITLVWRIIKMIIFAIITRAEDYSNKTTSQFKSGFLYVMNRIFRELFVSELGFYEVKKVIKSSNKVLFVNFSGYDEVSHHYGGYSNAALYHLSIVDLYIKGCYEEIKKNNFERELIVISDHGLTPCIPVTAFLGSSIGEKIISLYPNKNIMEHKRIYEHKYLKTSDLYLLNSGGFCLGYYMKTKSQATRRELENDFPEFCKKVSQISAIEFILAKEDRLIAIKLGQTFDFSMKNASILFPLIEKKYYKNIFDDLVQLMNGPYAPDVCLIAKIIEKNKVVDFEPQMSSHGAFGGFQTQSFLLSKKPFFPAGSLPHIRDLHDYLEKNIYQS